MSAVQKDPAGAITIRLRIAGGRVCAVDLSSSRRTDFSQRLFCGRPVAHLLTTLPMVFSVCATAQASAAAQACEQAAGVKPDPAHVQARHLLVLAETVREHLFRILLGWSGWLGVAPPAEGLGALGQMRAAWASSLYPGRDAFCIGGGDLRPQREQLTMLLGGLGQLISGTFGGALDSWNELDDVDSLRRWAASGDAIAQRMLDRVIESGLAELGTSPVATLPTIENAALDRLLTGDGVEDFVAAPVWKGSPCETGALQRHAAGPLVKAVMRTYGNGLLARLVARLSELAELSAQIGSGLVDLVPAPAAAATDSPSGCGLAQVEAARGLLVHRAVLTDGVVSNYRILAPTEWNFHPRGVLAQGLMGLPAGDELERLARLLVDAVDPCVEAHVELRTTG